MRVVPNYLTKMKKAGKREFEGSNNLKETETVSTKASRIDGRKGGQGEKVPEVLSSLPYSTIFERYIGPRMPVKILGLLTDAEWKGESWSNAYLREKAGEAKVRVEIREGNRFGKGLEKITTFGEFLDSLKHKDCMYYLTTQDTIYDEEAQPSIVSNPVRQLVGDFLGNPLLWEIWSCRMQTYGWVGQVAGRLRAAVCIMTTMITCTCCCVAGSILRCIPSALLSCYVYKCNCV